jgi:hypothetical protein
MRDALDALDRYKRTFGQKAPIELLPKGEEMSIIEDALRENRPIGEIDPID